jgi:hypothetical protein
VRDSFRRSRTEKGELKRRRFTEGDSISVERAALENLEDEHVEGAVKFGVFSPTLSNAPSQTPPALLNSQRCARGDSIRCLTAVDEHWY